MAAVTITAANVRRSEYATVVNKIAHATITAGQVVYLRPDDGKVALCYATDDAPPGYEAYGIAVNNAAANQDVDIVTRDPDFTIGAAVAVGAVYIAGDNGAIHPASDVDADWHVSALGVGISATKINLFPVDQCRSDAPAE